MKFSGNTVTLGKGRVSSARTFCNGDTGFVLDIGSALVYKEIKKGSKQPVFGRETVVSYGDDCFVLEKGKLERRGGLTYVRG